MDKIVFWSQDADFDKEFKGGMYVRSDLGKSFAKWQDSVKIVGIAIDDSNEVEFIVDENQSGRKTTSGHKILTNSTDLMQNTFRSFQAISTNVLKKLKTM